MSLLAKAPDEFTVGLPNPYLDIAVDGMILYDTDDFMIERLHGLKTLIRRKGLRREREWRSDTGGTALFPSVAGMGRSPVKGSENLAMRVVAQTLGISGPKPVYANLGR